MKKFKSVSNHLAVMAVVTAYLLSPLSVLADPPTNAKANAILENGANRVATTDVPDLASVPRRAEQAAEAAQELEKLANKLDPGGGAALSSFPKNSPQAKQLNQIARDMNKITETIDDDAEPALRVYNLALVDQDYQQARMIQWKKDHDHLDNLEAWGINTSAEKAMQADVDSHLVVDKKALADSESENINRTQLNADEEALYHSLESSIAQ